MIATDGKVLLSLSSKEEPTSKEYCRKPDVKIKFMSFCVGPPLLSIYPDVRWRTGTVGYRCHDNPR